MIETKEEYTKTIAMITDSRDSIGEDVRDTIEALREMARGAKLFYDWNVKIATNSQGDTAWATTKTALDALPDWITNGVSDR